MTWIKLEDKAPRHPKVAALSDRAFRAWVDGLCYAGEFLTDGVLPPVFYKKIPKHVRAELVDARLWDFTDPNLKIHDYLHHQTRRDDVEHEKTRNREKAASYRARKRNERARVTGNGDGDALPESNHQVPNPENREQIHITDTEKQKNSHAAPLVMSPLAYERRKAQCAFVGSRLEVPHQLHGELRKMLGGITAETDLLAWYEDLNTEIETSGEAIAPDVFRWLKARYTTWAKASGERTADQIIASLNARKAARS